jgi:hypothetical protein
LIRGHVASIADFGLGVLGELGVGEAQRSTATGPGRYGYVFGIATNQIVTSDGAKKKILSFGCSTGEEFDTLQKIAPDAEVYGCDIKTELIEKLSERPDGQRFFLSSAENIQRHGPFDMIACMSVLCSHPSITKGGKARGLDYRLFDRLIRTVFSALRENGVLVVYNSNYLVSGHELAANLIPVRTPRICHNGFIDLYEPGGNRVARGQKGTPKSAKGMTLPVRYVRDAEIRSLRDFSDTIFIKAPNPTGQAEISLLEPDVGKPGTLVNATAQIEFRPQLYAEPGEYGIYPVIRASFESFGSDGGVIRRAPVIISPQGEEGLGAYSEVLPPISVDWLTTLSRGL